MNDSKLVGIKDTIIEDDPDKMFEFADKYIAADKNYEVEL